MHVMRLVGANMYRDILIQMGKASSIVKGGCSAALSNAICFDGKYYYVTDGYGLLCISKEHPKMEGADYPACVSIDAKTLGVREGLTVPNISHIVEIGELSVAKSETNELRLIDVWGLLEACKPKVDRHLIFNPLSMSFQRIGIDLKITSRLIKGLPKNSVLKKYIACGPKEDFHIMEFNDGMFKIVIATAIKDFQDGYTNPNDLSL